MTHGMRTTARTNAPHQRLSFPVVMMMLPVTISARDPSLIPRVYKPSSVLRLSSSSRLPPIQQEPSSSTLTTFLPTAKGHVNMMMMMFITISARDYRSKGRRRKGAFVRRVT